MRLGRSYPGHLLELAALGTVADVGPLRGENRYIVKQGLKRINSTRNPGIRALAEIAQIRLGGIDTESLSFGIIPRINSAGRVGHADLSLALLTAPDRTRARRIATQLDQLNSERKRVTEAAMRVARRQAEGSSGADEPPHLLWVASESWIPGVLGLIAGRLSDWHYRPVVAVSLGDGSEPGQRAQHPGVRHRIGAGGEWRAVRQVRRPPPGGGFHARHFPPGRARGGADGARAARARRPGPVADTGCRPAKWT